MKTRHIALFGLDVSSGEDDVTKLERDFLLYRSSIYLCRSLFLTSQLFGDRFVFVLETKVKDFKD